MDSMLHLNLNLSVGWYSSNCEKNSKLQTIEAAENLQLWLLKKCTVTLHFCGVRLAHLLQKFCWQNIAIILCSIRHCGLDIPIARFLIHIPSLKGKAYLDSIEVFPCVEAI